ncbi:BTAD domain-containing putative transcriptional regulator [Allonocardiopsis opalescens]|uniref:Putative ATPase n=1 Tax=Allonocardiopsis opalescens TaxID=1144618 RepID=A0A2T0PSF3_9ACTN|nr:BTAD domain-containing putative transcriptional regulator [Allonocardiopsis opalescens]PRX91832.1 putative ATPase [Allonocardiopsis opalescens]
MRFGVLGPLAVWTERGEPVAVPGLKVRALLADLLISAGRPVPADRLIDDLWPADPPGNPAGALSAKVSQLRRALEDAEPGARALVVSRPGGYLLDISPDLLDAQRFEALADRADKAGEPHARAALLADALALWRGPALADFADDAFARTYTARLEERRLTAHEDRAEARLELGEHVRLAGELTELVAAHPLRERLRAAQLRALYGAGRRTEALDGYRELRERLAEELGLDPGPELAALHLAMLNSDPALRPPERRPPLVAAQALPVPLTELVGREEAVAEIGERLAVERLVTLTGPGGVGKTRLALEVAARRAGGFPDGVRLVELAALPGGSGEALTDVVLAALDVSDAAGPLTAVDRLATAIGARELLLVLDNCEHVVEEVAELAERLLRAAPGLRVLATSREPLAVHGESVWNVPPLDVPDRAAAAEPELLERCGAVRLFVSLARSADRGFTLDAGTAPAVAVLCRRLDGIPLALELAANRVRALGVHGLVERLDDRFRLLATGHRGRPPRQRTLTAMIDWSWELLTGPERAVLRRLAVHADGCTIEAAEAVCADAELPAGEVLDVLSRLVDRSLVVAVHSADGTRYRLLESVSAYGLDRLAEAGETAEVRARHQHHYARLAEVSAPLLHGSGQRARLRRLTAEAANLRAAVDGALADGRPETALRITCALLWFWFLRGRLGEARRTVQAVLAADDGSRPELAARAAAWSAGFAVQLGDGADWGRRRDAALARFEGVDDPLGRAMAEWWLALSGSDSSDLAAGDALLDRAEAVFAAHGDDWGTAAALTVRAKHAHARGDTAALTAAAEASARLFERLGDGWGLLQSTEWLAARAELAGDYGEAARLHRDGLRTAELLELWPVVAGQLAWLSWTALQTRDFGTARAYGERARRLYAEQGSTFGTIFADLVLGHTARKTGELDTAARHLEPILANSPRQDTGEGLPLHLTLILTELGFVAELRGDAAAAYALHLEALMIAREVAPRRDGSLALEGLAGALALAGRPGPAARLLGAAAAGRAAAATPCSPAEQADVDRIAAGVRTALGAEAYAAEYERGRSLDADEALELARAAAPG